MLILAVTAVAMVIAGVSVWLLALRWAALRLAPRVEPGRIRSAVHRHPRLAAAADTHLDPTSTTGLALTATLAVLVVGAVGFGVLLIMVRSNAGFAHFDLGAARFAARHASPASTNVLRAFSQLGGAVVLVPITIVVGLVAARRYH